MFVYDCVSVCIYVCMCVDICVCVCVYVFIQDPDPGSDPELSEKSDPDPGSDPKKIIPDPQHCSLLSHPFFVLLVLLIKFAITVLVLHLRTVMLPNASVELVLKILTMFLLA